MPTVIDDLVVRISGDTENLTKELTDAEKFIQEFTRKTSSKQLTAATAININEILKVLERIEPHLTKIKAEQKEVVKETNNWGKVLKTATGILASGVGVKWFKSIYEETLKAETAMLRLQLVFKGVSDDATNFVNSFEGLSRSGTAVELAKMGAALTDIGINNSAALEMSKTLVSLGADLQSISGGAVSVERAVSSLTSALLGTGKAVRGLGIGITQANLEVMAEALGYNAKEMDAATRAIVTYNEILRQSADIQGSYAKGVDTLAVAQQDFKNALTDLKDVLGTEIQPLITNMMKIFTSVIETVSNSPFLRTFVEWFAVASIGAKGLQVVLNSFGKSTLVTMVKNLATAEKGTKGLTAAMKGLESGTVVGAIAKLALVVLPSLVMWASSASDGVAKLKKTTDETAQSFATLSANMTNAEIKEFQKSLAETEKVYEKQQQSLQKINEAIQRGNDELAKGATQYLAEDTRAAIVYQLQGAYEKEKETLDSMEDTILTLARSYMSLDAEQRALVDSSFTNKELLGAVQKKTTELEQAQEKAAKKSVAFASGLTGVNDKLKEATEQLEKLQAKEAVTIPEIEEAYKTLNEGITEELNKGLSDLGNYFTFVGQRLAESLTANSTELQRRIVSDVQFAVDTWNNSEDKFNVDGLSTMFDLAFKSGLINEQDYAIIKTQIGYIVKLYEIEAKQREASNIKQEQAEAARRKKEQKAERDHLVAMAEFDKEKTLNLKRQLDDEIVAIDAQYDYRIEQAKANGEEIENIERERQEAILALRREYSQKAYEVEEERIEKIRDLDRGREDMYLPAQISEPVTNIAIGLRDANREAEDLYENLRKTFDGELFKIGTELGYEDPKYLADMFDAEFSKAIKTGDFQASKDWVDMYVNMLKVQGKEDLAKTFKEVFDYSFEQAEEVVKARNLRIHQLILGQLSDLIGVAQNLVKAIGDTQTQMIQSTIKGIENSIDKYKEDMSKANDEVYDGISVKEKDALKRRQEMDKEELERLQKAKEEQEKLLEEQRKKEFERDKAFRAAQAGVQIAQAMISAFSAGISTGGPAAPAIAAAMMAMAGAVGAAQLAAIMAQQYTPSYDVGAWEIPENQTAQLHKGEVVVPQPFASAFRANGGNLGGGEVIINVYGTTDDVQVESAESDEYKELNIYMTSRVKQMVASGELDTVLQSRYAINRNGRRS